MPISDLTGTTWVFDGFSVETFGDSYNISFQSNGNNYIKYEWEADVIGEGYELVWVRYYSSVNSFIYAYQDGDWTNEAYATITITGGTDATSSSPYFADLLDFLEANATQQSSQLSVDLSTLSGWSNVSSGSHTLKVKAKATGYRDSELSTGVSFTKGASGYYVHITGVGGESTGIDIYDGQDSTATLLFSTGEPSSQGISVDTTVSCTSGYLSILGRAINDAAYYSGTLSAGITLTSSSYDYGLYTVTSNGSITGIEVWEV